METIEILTEIIRHQNHNQCQESNLELNDQPQDITKVNFYETPTQNSSLNHQKSSLGIGLNDSKTVTDSLKEYLDNLNNTVVNAVNYSSERGGETEEEGDISIRETLTIQQRTNGKRGRETFFFGFLYVCD